jgi:hypothetical protein
MKASIQTGVCLSVTNKYEPIPTSASRKPIFCNLKYVQVAGTCDSAIAAFRVYGGKYRGSATYTDRRLVTPPDPKPKAVGASRPVETTT